MRYKLFPSIIALLLVLLFQSCATEKPELKVDYEKYTLDNGLQVILHKDTSDPITAVAIMYHVGSNREVTGKTGFAHLFEHMMFQESQHVAQDQLFNKIHAAGGTLNGGTWKDGTVYFEVVPKNSLEMVLWLESDRMGYLLPTVTYDAFVNQQEVVQNEKRQNYDNRPYGQTSIVINKTLYPEGHPYNWSTIGSLDDLRNASLKDVHEFYKKYYVPNNATLVIAGDFDEAKTKEMVEKYFGEIKAADKVEKFKPVPVTLDKTKKVYFEDKLISAPELNMVFPTVEMYNKDSYALTILGELLADGKKAPLYKVIVEDKKFAPSVSGYQSSSEGVGVFQIRVRAFPQKNLADVEKSIFEALNNFEKDGFTEEDLARIKARTETDFYNEISSALGKSFKLAEYNTFAGSPDFVTTDLDNFLNVTKDDIWAVYNKYIKEKPYVLSSFVPKGNVNLVAENSSEFILPEEDIASVTKPEMKEGDNVKVDKIASSFDRNVEPAKGPDPSVKIPEIWRNKLNNGMKVLGIENNELPLVQFSITVKGGLLMDSKDKVGVANLLTDEMMEGTKNKTPLELQEAIDNLGASIRMYTTDESIVIQANSLASKFGETFSLVKEILLEPRWDKKEFDRLKAETLEKINRNKTNPASIANNVFTKLIYGPDHILSNSSLGTVETVSSITLDDLKNYYDKNISPGIAYTTIVGDISQQEAMAEFASLEEGWKNKDVAFPEYKTPEPPAKPQVYFVDIPGAKQSQIFIGYLALPFTHPDFYPATVMNYKLGGSFDGILNLILREEKGFTYGARSGFSGSVHPGPFVARSGVQSNATYESVKIFHDEMAKYGKGISDENLEFTKDALLKSNARRFETLYAKLSMLNEIAAYNLSDDYVKTEEEIIRNMTKERHKELAQKYVNPDKMIYVIVGDAATQLKEVKKVGLGTPVMLDKDGNPAS